LVYLGLDRLQLLALGLLEHFVQGEKVARQQAEKMKKTAPLPMAAVTGGNAKVMRTMRPYIIAVQNRVNSRFFLLGGEAY